MSDVTRILNFAEAGDPKAAKELLSQLYEGLRRLARHKMAELPLSQAIQPTELARETWSQSMGSGRQDFENNPHFVVAHAKAMRRTMIDLADGKLMDSPQEHTKVLHPPTDVVYIA